MNTTETLALVRYVRAACPQQKFDEYTPDAWVDLLGDLAFGDCKIAAKNLAQRQPFISPSEIRGEVRRIRAERLRAVESSLLEPHDVDPNDTAAYIAAKKRRIEAVASGEPVTVEPIPIGDRSDEVGRMVGDVIRALPKMPRALPELNKRRPRPVPAAGAADTEEATRETA